MHVLLYLSKYYYKATEKEITDYLNKNFFSTKINWDRFLVDYPAPEWCMREHPTRGYLGCHKLFFFKIKGRDDCKECEHYRSEK